MDGSQRGHPVRRISTRFTWRAFAARNICAASHTKRRLSSIRRWRGRPEPPGPVLVISEAVDIQVTRLSRSMSGRKPSIEAELEILQRESFSYFVHETNPSNGLVIDKTAPDWPASIAATG